MATSMTPPSNGELWHLSIDDLLGPLPETFRLGGPGPFVINLRASSTSMSPTPSTLQGFENVTLYQIQRIEDEVLRFRLRLGPFASEDEADAVLVRVRDSYPCALTATAASDDLQAIELLRKPKVQMLQPSVPKAAAVAAAPVIAPTAVVAPTAAIAPAAVVAPTPVAATTPVIATKPVVLAATTPARALPSPPPPSAGAVSSSNLENPFESTQTVRRLTPAELSAAQTLRWFVIELSLTDHAIDPETVPNLDIYSLYRLYSVVELDQGRRLHALRLGFFSEEIAAKAVASYLTEYYEKPAIKRVSVAERERFLEQRIEARKDVGATGMHAIIEITSDRVARPVRKSAAPPPEPA